MPKANGPPNRIPIHSYAKVLPWMDAFGRGDFNLLFLTGAPGLGKTRLVREALKDRQFLLLEGHATPLKTYERLYRHRDQLVVIDDEDSFHADPLKIRLMKCLCSTEPTKRVTWDSTSKLLEDRGLPAEFVTASKVAVLTNGFGAVNPQVAALFDRGCVLDFQPSKAEIHRRVETWFTDREVLDFFLDWLGIVPILSMRHYLQAAEMKRARIDWRECMLLKWKAGKVARIDELQNDPEVKSEEERAVAFETRGHGSRATYFRHLGKWRQAMGKRRGHEVVPEDDGPVATPPPSPLPTAVDDWSI